MSEVLALKYRPRDFSEVIGQEHTVRELQSALEKGTLGHALLFCGTRGSGKTTTARIVAHQLNANVENWDAAYSLIVSEIDAASNTGVDNIREIIENVRYSTQGHRVVILDEAHMLTRNAFNAFLKTLEEPPPGVTFILLTTEPHKLIPTVLSRCQRYEFHDVDLGTLAGYYKEIGKKEGLSLSDEVYWDIALKAEGSVRDGLTILQKHLSGEEVESNASAYFELVSAIYNQDVTSALDLVAALRKKEEPRNIIQTLEKWWYFCSLEHFGMKTPIRDFFGETKLVFDLSYLQQLFDICLDIERSFTATPNSKVVLDMGIIKLCGLGN